MSLANLELLVPKPWLSGEIQNLTVDGTLTANNITIDNATIDNLTVTTNLTVGNELMVDGFSSLNTLQVTSLATLNGPVVINNQNVIENQRQWTFGAALPATIIVGSTRLNSLDGTASSTPSTSTESVSNTFLPPGVIHIGKVVYNTATADTTTVFSILVNGISTQNFTCTGAKGIYIPSPVIIVSPGSTVGCSFATGTSPQASVVSYYAS